VKFAAYQAPVLPVGSTDALGLIRRQVERCEAEHVSILCCPEAILGGIADYADNPHDIAISAGHLNTALEPLASDTVTTIVGFTELSDEGCLYNSAAVVRRGTVAGMYRKIYPAINRSVYEPGCELPIFQVGELTFGIVICNDSNYFELAKLMAARGATALFVPTNNGLPPNRASTGLVADARKVDIAAAVTNKIWVIRADVAGRTGRLVSHGSTVIIDPGGRVVRSGREMSEDLLAAEIDVEPRPSTHEIEAADSRRD
jgi:predicted amidohydrolase